MNEQMQSTGETPLAPEADAQTKEGVLQLFKEAVINQAQHDPKEDPFTDEIDDEVLRLRYRAKALGATENEILGIIDSVFTDTKS